MHCSDDSLADKWVSVMHRLGWVQAFLQGVDERKKHEFTK